MRTMATLRTYRMHSPYIFYAASLLHKTYLIGIISSTSRRLGMLKIVLEVSLGLVEFKAWGLWSKVPATMLHPHLALKAVAC